ncbi:MAG: hypothetical protein J6S26_04420 [Solobacterium sp.]|nr:hypothetical protein [Solobacterium sp.]
MLRIETETFRLEWNALVHEEDRSAPVNTSLLVHLFSYDYSASALLDTSVQDLSEFARQLNEVYETLRGTARLQFPYDQDSCFEFTTDPTGHFRISGCISNGHAHGFTQKLYFENEAEQTYLKEFVKSLYRAFPMEEGLNKNNEGRI